MVKVTKKRLRRHKGRAGGDADTFAKLPTDVLQSEAHRTLPHPARSVLVALADQYRGHNNGSLTLTRVYAALKYGITNPYSLDESLRELEERGLIVETRPGTRPNGRVRPRSAMFALTWVEIHTPDPNDPHNATETIYAPDTWQSWKASKVRMHWTVRRRDRNAEKGSFVFREQANHGAAPAHPGDTKTGIHGIPRKGPFGTPGIPEPARNTVSRGCVSDISVGRGRREQVDERAGCSHVSPPPLRSDSSSATMPSEIERPVRPEGEFLDEDDLKAELFSLFRPGFTDEESAEAIAKGLLRRGVGFAGDVLRGCRSRKLYGHEAFHYAHECIKREFPEKSKKRRAAGRSD